MLASKSKFAVAVALTLVGLVAAVTAVQVRSQASSVQPAKATLLIPERCIDLGVLLAGEQREVAFTVTNQGNRRLVINEITPDCNCKNPVRRTTLIPPGETENLVVSIDGWSGSGSIGKKLLFSSNDPVEPRFELTVRAQIEQPQPLSGNHAAQPISVLRNPEK